MTYVDPLMNHGWCIRGHAVPSCHLFTDQLDLAELHAAAMAIGCKRTWFQEHTDTPHYDLTARRRELAIAAGVQEITRRQAVEIWQQQRAAIAAAARSQHGLFT